MDFKTIDDVLDYAISKEEEAHEFYIGLSKKMEREEMVKVFQDFAAEELGHKKKLLDIKKGKQFAPSPEKVKDLKIGDYHKDVEIVTNLDYQQALVLAMKAEKNAFRLYSALATAAENPEIGTIFQMLAQEEAKHKLRFEIEYDEIYMQES